VRCLAAAHNGSSSSSTQQEKGSNVGFRVLLNICHAEVLLHQRGHSVRCLAAAAHNGSRSSSTAGEWLKTTVEGFVEGMPS
jgi:hypothetical protein